MLECDARPAVWSRIPGTDVVLEAAAAFKAV